MNKRLVLAVRQDDLDAYTRAVRKAIAERLERGWEILLELEQHGHPCDCDFCNELWQEYIKLRREQDDES